jgi:hypothetical protein
MSLSDPRWDDLADADWDAFARAWIAELSGDEPRPLPDLPVLFPDDPETTASAFVVPMNFTASAEAQWRFIEAVFRLGNDEAMGHLAGGPVEHFLSKHGGTYIERFETLARTDPRFARMLTGCYKHMMSDTVWDRICAARGDVG